MFRMKALSTLVLVGLMSIGVAFSVGLISCGKKDPVGTAPGPTSSWKTVTSPTSEHFLGAWGSAGDDVFTVGANGVIVHFNGTSWATQSSLTLEDLNGVWGTADDNVITVGDAGVVRLYNGTSWSAMTNSNSEDLNSIWGSAADDIYAVGSNGVIRRFTGSSSWGGLRSITIREQSGVWGSAADDIVTVGETSTIFHYDTADWVFGSNSAVEFLQTADRRGIRKPTSSDPLLLAFLAIKDITEDRTVLDFDITPLGTTFQSAWLDLSLQNLDDGGTPENIDVFRYEGDGTIVADEFYSGSFTTQFPFNDANGVTSALLTTALQNGIDFNWDYLALRMSTNTTDRYNLPYSSYGAYPTLIVVNAPSPPNLNSVWGSADDDVFAVGNPGKILHYDGTDWSSMTSGTNVSLNAVWGTSGSDVFAVGDDGTVLHYNGSSWGAQTSGTTENLNALWGSAGNNVYAFGENGTILKYGP